MYVNYWPDAANSGRTPLDVSNLPSSFCSCLVLPQLGELQAILVYLTVYPRFQVISKNALTAKNINS